MEWAAEGGESSACAAALLAWETVECRAVRADVAQKSTPPLLPILLLLLLLLPLPLLELELELELELGLI